ncbi:hypothetical protein KIL84_010216 [Mauremys mutica]|uniref:Uncharacterized protein n=1 Tax=Mauremys mutica TaxID=74926 RepID=A0A9D3XML7_9SAUR|nr:hypothetical protein KIL84_010216 [Mauremys mutica]
MKAWLLGQAVLSEGYSAACMLRTGVSDVCWDGRCFRALVLIIDERNDTYFPPANPLRSRMSGTGVRGPMFPRGSVMAGHQWNGGVGLEAARPRRQSSVRGLLKLHLATSTCAQPHALLGNRGGRAEL